MAVSSSRTITPPRRPRSRLRIASRIAARRPLVAALSLLLLTSCQSNNPGPGGMHVSLTLPKGPVESVNSIDVSFDAPVAAVGQTGLAPQLVRIKPRLAGKARWIGTRTWSFVPDRPFPRGTTFECVVPAGTRSADRSKSVGQDVRWSFSTPRPAVVRSWPEAGTLDAAPDVTLLLQFNQPVDPNSVARAARLRPVGAVGASGGSPVGLRAERPGPAQKAVVDSWPEAPLLTRVLLRPEKPLPRDTGWILELDAPLKGMEGPQPMGERWQTDFRTFGDFRITAARLNPEYSDQLTLKLTNRVDEDSLRAHLRFDPPAEVEYVSAWNPGEAQVGAQFRPGAEHTVTFTPGLRDLFGNALEAPAAPLRFRTPDARPSIAIVPGDAVLERTRVREAALIVTNVAEVQLEMARVSATELQSYQQAWLRQRELGRGENPRPPLPAGRLTRVFRRRTAWNRPDTLRVALDEALGGRGGLLVLHATALDAPPTALDSVARFQRKWPPSASTTLRVTDLGLTAKTSPGGGVAWVTSLATGEPRPGVALELRNGEGRSLWSGVTDGEGLARVGALPVDYLRGEGAPRLWARLGDDETYLSVGRDWSLEPWNFGVESEAWDPGRDRAGFLYGDRELYRPGDTVHMKGIIRRRDTGGLHAPSEARIGVEVSDPRGNTLLKEDRDLSRFGTLALDLPLKPGAPLGYYAVRVQPAGLGTGWVVYGSFRVEEYRAPDFKVDLTPRRRDYLSGDKLDATLSAQYLFGAPLSSAPVSWIVRRNPFHFSPAGYEEFQFGDPEIEPEYGTFGGDGRLTLGADGRASLTAPLDLGQLPVSLRFEIEATVRDQTARSVSATTQVTVHRGDVYPGLRLDRYFVDAGQTVPVTVVTLNPAGQPAAAATARVTLVRREWRTARRLQVGGIIGSETTPFDSTLESRPLPAGPGPHRLEFRIPTGGYYRIVAEATDGRRNTLRTVGVIYAAGAGEFAWGWEPGVKVELVADKKIYRPGDTARILVRSPFKEARALITLEREGLLSTETRLLTGTSETVSVQIPAQGGAPNVIVSVALVTGSNAREGADPRLRLPEFRLGYLSLPVEAAGRRLEVVARPERAEAGPGDSLNVEIEVRDAAGQPVAGEVSLAVVDEAVLRLLGTQTPDPHAAFYRSRGTALTTSELRRLVRLPLSTGGRKGEEPGGGGGEEGFRKLFAATACWRPAVLTGADGRARVGFRLPDNLTTFRVMAVAVDAADRFGSGDTTFVVTKPLLVQPALPRFARTGDEFMVGAVVHNRTEAPVTISLTREFIGFEPADPKEPSSRDNLVIPANGSRRFDFGARATNAGPVLVRLQAVGAGPGLVDRLKLELPILDPAARVYSATAGELADATAREMVSVPMGVVPDSSWLTVTLSPTLLGGLAPAFQFLREYRYTCLEQTASMALGRLLEARLLAGAPVAEAAARAVARLAPYQNGDGGFHLWPGGGPSVPWVTAYALLVLEEARRSGADAGDMEERAARHLGWSIESATPSDGKPGESLTQTALALWAMARLPVALRGDRVLTGPIDYLMARRPELEPLGKLYLALAAAESPGGADRAATLLADLDNAMEQRADLAWLPAESPTGWGRGWSSRPQKAGLYLAASLAAGRHSPLEPRVVRWLMEERRSGHWGDTQSDAMALYGLAAWQEAREAAAPDIRVALDYAGRALDPAHLTLRQEPPAERRAKAGAPGSTQPLTLTRSGAGTLYYTVGLSLLEPTVGRLPRENGLTLIRQREALGGAEPGGAAASALRAGDLVLTRLTLVVPEEVDYLVLADPLPAGLEPVQLDFVTSGNEAGRQMEAAATPDRARLPVEAVELRDREVRAYVSHLAPGVYEYRYLTRALTEGRFASPCARAELMYHPEVSALSDGMPLVIRR